MCACVSECCHSVVRACCAAVRHLIVLVGMHRSKRSKSPAVDGDGDDSAEYLDPGQGDEKLHLSSPNLTEDPVKTVKKKKHFKVFHRHSSKGKHKNELDQKLSDSLPAGKSNGHGLLSESNRRWSEDSRKGQRNLEKLSSSVYSSSASLLSVESERREMSDEEMVESLVNPQGMDSPSVASISSVSLVVSAEKLSSVYVLGVCKLCVSINKNEFS